MYPYHTFRSLKLKWNILKLESDWGDSGEKRKSGDENDGSVTPVFGGDGNRTGNLCFRDRHCLQSGVVSEGQRDVGAEQVVLDGSRAELTQFAGSVRSAFGQVSSGFGFSGQEGNEVARGRSDQHEVVFSESPGIRKNENN